MSNAGGHRIHIMKIFSLNTTVKSTVRTQILGVCEQLISNMLELQDRNNRRLQRLHNEKPYILHNNKQIKHKQINKPNE